MTRPAYSVDCIPPGLPFVWHAGLVACRIVQLVFVVLDYPWQARWGHAVDPRREPLIRQQARAMEELCGIIRPEAWRRPHWEPRPVTVCGQCGKQVWRLYGYLARWWCRYCWPGATRPSTRGWSTGYSRTEVLLGDYACGVRIGLADAQMLRRRQRLLERLRTRHLRRRQPKDLVLIAQGAQLLGPRPTWSRRGYKAGAWEGWGPVGEQLRAHLLPVLVDNLLHRDAYLGRFWATAGSG